MRSCTTVAMSVWSRSTAALVSSFRQRSTKRGLAIALFLAAILMPGSALAQSHDVLKKTGIPNELTGGWIHQEAAPRAARFNNSATTSSTMELAKRVRANEVARIRTQKKVTPFTKFETLREKGMWLIIPGPADTIDLDRGGVRSALADVGIGYVGGTVNSLINNQLPNAGRTRVANQLYMGQNPTFGTVNFLIVTYDLSRFGVPDGQIIVGAEQQYWSWEAGGPDRLGINIIAYYQTLFGGKLELKMGYLRNQNEFAGTLVGGSAAATVLGPSSNILYQAGMSNNAAPTPALNLKYNLDDRLYNRVSIQRSLSPDGQYAQITENPTGLNWSTTNARILWLNETGYKNKAAPGVPETWLRGGIGYNTSNFKSLAYPNHQLTNGNSVYYVAADRQLWQSDVDGLASRGIYGGFSVMYAPPDLNNVSQYYELRLYAKGLFDSRPSDQIAIVATNAVWSNFAVDAALVKGHLAHHNTTAISGTYTAHLAPGVYASLGLTYINKPTSVTHTRETDHALNLLVSTSIFF
ncbi:carbohydrate porin [Bradyrhizobium sp. CCGB12]|uniref:carbohydrate porin n=1 Tax=Bradyrhizobium sp. CCGB12 TaxID=2949632 RepID=UPI0020B25123|nr:carbohydrate porin [Bradyrhizobium sp. CCGB12]MCP3392150.1 carbohydrate porin [Bradyrhizobium sp. CCGB12]